MRNFKKVLSIALASAMAMALLSGCANGSNDTGASANDSAQTETGSDNTEAAESNNETSGADSEAAGGEVFKIGAIGPATGGAAVYGLAVQNGADLAIKEINEAGGINGVMIEYNFQDDELDNEKSVNAYNTLKDWGMQM